MITVDNITSHEFIGLHTEITKSSNPQIIGLNGRIVDETGKVKTETEQIAIEEEKMKNIETLEEEENRLKWLELAWRLLNN